MRGMSRRPVIGITLDHVQQASRYMLPKPYVQAVERAGGLPLLLPYAVDHALIDAYADLIDGMLFTGGDDLDPSRWGQVYHPNAKPIDPDRERFEMALLAAVEKRRLPTLGICLGSQVMNVYRGGTMQQFIPDMNLPVTIEHRRLGESWEARHPVRLESASTLSDLLRKSEVSANTSHKQCMGTIGKGLRVIGTAPDGIVEALEDPSMPLWLGVQWHPERQIDEPDHLRLFELLVDKANRRG
jgi:putative glutamine amidotransferase